MQVVNVLECVNDVPTRIWSHVVLFDTESHRNEVSELAEKKFLSLLKEHGVDIDDENDGSYLLEDGIYDDDDGYQVVIIWSERLN